MSETKNSNPPSAEVSSTDSAVAKQGGDATKKDQEQKGTKTEKQDKDGKNESEKQDKNAAKQEQEQEQTKMKKKKKKLDSEDKEKVAKLHAAVGKFDVKKWDEIARWIQKQPRFVNNLKQAPLHIPIAPRQEHSSVRQYLSGKALRRLVSSKAFAEKFSLEFDKSTADILLVPMMRVVAAKPDMKKNLGKRYFVQAETWQKEPLVKLKLSNSRERNSKFSNHEIRKDEPYAWVFEGSVMWRHILLGTIIGVFLLACLFPVWPDFMKVGVWYLSVTLLLFLFAFFVARGVIFVMVWVCGYDFWILPNILDDDLPPIESFKPLYSLQPHPKSKSGWMYRISVGVVLCASLYWVYVQPNAYHAEMLNEQRSFVEDLYSGKFLSDRSAASSSNLDEVIPDYEELMQEELQEKLSDEEQAAQNILDEILKEDEEQDSNDDDSDKDN